ncbi:MAG: histidine phosphatase family protein [Negativibacillus sp.]
MVNRMTTVYLVRHGETDSNISHCFQGRSNIPLNENGRRQSDLLGQALKDHSIDGIFSSYLDRAKETAQRIGVYHPEAPVLVYPGLEEVDVGLAEGKTLSWIAENYPELYRCMSEEPAKIQYPQGESCRQVYERMIKAVEGIVEQHRGKTLVVVSHGFTIQNYIHYASGKAFEDMDCCIVANTSRSKFAFEDRSLVPHMVYGNQHDHLSDRDFTEFQMKIKE